MKALRQYCGRETSYFLQYRHRRFQAAGPIEYMHVCIARYAVVCAKIESLVPWGPELACNPAFELAELYLVVISSLN
jgi:hypothetical protein